jgi:excisionase family DNA binding protein
MGVTKEGAPDLMDVGEGAGYCHIEESTMRSWILQNKVTYVKLGRRVFLRKSDLDALISVSVVPAKVARQREGADAR